MKENLNDYIAEKIHNENRRRIRALLKECVYLEQVQRAFADFPQGEIQEMFNDLQNEYLEKMRAGWLHILCVVLHFLVLPVCILQTCTCGFTLSHLL